MLLFIKLNVGVEIDTLTEKLNDLKRFIGAYKGVELLDAYDCNGLTTAVYECICGNVAPSTVIKHMDNNFKELYKNVSCDYSICIELDNFYSNYVSDGLRELAEKQAYTGVNEIRFYPKNQKGDKLTLTLVVGNVSKSFYVVKEDYLIKPILKMTGVQRVYHA